MYIIFFLLSATHTHEVKWFLYCIIHMPLEHLQSLYIALVFVIITTARVYIYYSNVLASESMLTNDA